jgi:low affinity Fe/Cu permease
MEQIWDLYITIICFLMCSVIRTIRYKGNVPVDMTLNDETIRETELMRNDEAIMSVMKKSGMRKITFFTIDRTGN